ncbi:Anther-specific protein LAT52 precursor, putative [Ricinus communis]|uniref:Anther-specific protein LAT52, putative n=1 Tax=Ricinus communis TaxID=3988 RepID=B9SBK9_RICCO|nr:Anther-specific protein LAT52 precursor, putative [Ricinus communis]|eukprot:XP_002523378.1 olee1-like protein [Ricinus communis]
MAKSFTFGALIASALCFSSLLSSALATAGLYVEGKVYCDTCRVEFETKLSEVIPGTRVKLECKNRENNTLTYAVEGVTDASGIYRLPVEGEHEEDLCEVKLIKSGKPDCAEAFKSVDHARVLLTHNVGVVQPTRYTNPLGFMKQKASPECGKVLQDMGFVPLDNLV